MQNINSILDLKLEIQKLEQDQLVQGRLLKEDFELMYDNFRPFNMLGALGGFGQSSGIMSNIFSTVLGLSTGYFSKRVFGKSGQVLTNLISSLLQVGIAGIIARKPLAIKSLAQKIIQRIRFKRGNEA